MNANLKKALPLLAAAALLATGCSAGPEPTDFQSVDELVSAWEDYTGQECSDPDNTAYGFQQGMRGCSDTVAMTGLGGPGRTIPPQR